MSVVFMTAPERPVHEYTYALCSRAQLSVVFMSKAERDAHERN